MSGGSSTVTQCSISIASTDQTVTNGGTRSVSVAVDSCSSSGGIITTGSGCEFTLPDSYGDQPDCTPGGSGGVLVSVVVIETPNPMLGTITQVSDNGVTGTYIWTRTASGTQTISWTELETICSGHGTTAHKSTGTITFN
jgi:hypothetical protein